MPPARPKTKRATKDRRIKRKPCQFCADKAIDVSYRDVNPMINQRVINETAANLAYLKTQL